MAWSTPATRSTGFFVIADTWNQDVVDNTILLKTAIADSGHISFVDATELTIAAGVITVTQNYHKVDTQDNDATDDLDTITAGASVAAGFPLFLRVESGARTVVLKDGADNLDLGTDVTLDETHKTFALIYDGTNWRPLTLSTDLLSAGIGTETYTPAGVIHVDTTQAGTDANTDEKTLASYSLPANTLSANHALIEIVAFGTFADNANDKTIKLKFGGTTISTSPTAGAQQRNVGWEVKGVVIRTGATAQKAYGTFQHRNTLIAIVGASEFSSPSETLSGAVTLLVTGQNGTGTANDIVFESLIVKYAPAP